MQQITPEGFAIGHYAMEDIMKHAFRDNDKLKLLNKTKRFAFKCNGNKMLDITWKNTTPQIFIRENNQVFYVE